LCDFDGTVAVDDTTDTLLARFGRPGWEALESKWRDGLIGSRDCMAGQVALLDMDAAELDAHLGERRLDPDFGAFVAAGRAAGFAIEILSDGLDYAIHAILRRNGLEQLPVVSNRLLAAGERSWRLEFPNAHAQCRASSGTCKCARAAASRKDGSRVLMIGDGASDFCVAGAADYVFAKGKLIDYCRRQGIAHAPIRDFADVIGLLPRLLSGQLDAVDYTGSRQPRTATA